ncbi:hypothetical protein GQ464_003065 [Rhodocaloribacter litoris]|uniref:hypothetical protein n=1 Tax=Rhodocaloribacter litoris TaxID=2558931 RepID=UPI0014213A08|nr:hypothetical protein [Rhodocaloribacter litoris]QXD15945.1 hypothetical protein GQ464_003065 [Rhodocaloribacter litoris]GIV60151.1 MAG: hypothetical protein KatS3mg043_1240 [Rhodothermaceae bacterium]
MSASRTKYRQAAIAYLIYGLIYLSGAVYLMETGMTTRSGAIFYGLGVLFILVIPPLIWKGIRWFTRLIAFLLAFRIAGLIRLMLNDEGEVVPLPWGGELPMLYGTAVFALVATVTCTMLVRAAWDQEKTTREAA